MRPNGTGLSAGIAIAYLLVSGLATAQPGPTPVPTPTTPTAPTAPTGPVTTAPVDTTTPAPVDTTAPTTTATTTTPEPAVAADTGASSHSRSGPLGTAFGVGIHAFLAGPYGPSLVYNMYRFHIEGILAFQNAGGTNVAIGGKAWFHIHQTRMSTLSIGGGAAFESVETMTIDPRTGSNAKATLIDLEGGAQIRFFATDNVALSAAVGLAIVTGDGDSVALTGQLQGAVGLTYFIY